MKNTGLFRLEYLNLWIICLFCFIVDAYSFLLYRLEYLNFCISSM